MNARLRARLALALQGGARRAENLSRCTGRVVDLTHTYDSAFPTWDGKPASP